LGAVPGATQGAGEERLLALESRVPLGNVRGRIDHLAVDLSHKRLFVAELGNDSVGVVDLAAARLLRRITGLSEPQGVGYVPSIDALYAANARDGSVRVFSGDDYAPSGRIDLGSDADNIRIDPATNTVFVGYGDGAIAAIDPTTRKKISDTRLPAHPEGFQVASTKIFVNVPERRAIVTIDRASGQPAASWPTQNATANFPMALDETNQHVIVVFRKPARLAVFAMTTGERLAERDTCGDSDDVFVDAKRARLYVSCGDGRVDVFDAQAPYQRRGRIATVPGARTSLFMPGLDRLAVAVRATAAGPAAIWIYRPEPE
jgi:DNA-binding beta-propeller fold protein YncE